MHSIISLFRTIIGYAAIISIVLPVIAAILARRNGAKLSFEMRLFEFYCYVAAIGQILGVIMAFTIGHYTILFRIILIVYFLIILYLFLKWMNFERFYVKSLLGLVPILFVGDYLFNSSFPDFMLWVITSIMLSLSLILSYIIDRNKINFPKEYSYIHLGIYLYSIIIAIGFTPTGTEIRQYGHLIQATASFISIYYFYRSFRCLYR